MFASKAFVQLIANPFVGRLTNKYKKNLFRGGYHTKHYHTLNPKKLTFPFIKTPSYMDTSMGKNKLLLHKCIFWYQG